MNYRCVRQMVRLLFDSRPSEDVVSSELVLGTLQFVIADEFCL